MNNIFLTGATGFLGGYLIKSFLEEDNNVYVLIRARNNKELLERKEKLIKDMFPVDLISKAEQKIHAIRGDIKKVRLGISKEDFLYLQKKINIVFNSAAITAFDWPLSKIRKINVLGTEHLMDMLLTWKHHGALETINHISTSYVVGKYSDIFYENQTNVNQEFNNSYEQSKFESEQLLEIYKKKGLIIDVFRPSIIVDSIPVNINRISLLLRFLKILVAEIFNVIPFKDETRMNFISVDNVVKAICTIAFDKEKKPNKVYHIVNPNFILFKELLDYGSKTFEVTRPVCLSEEDFQNSKLSFIQRRLSRYIMPYLKAYVNHSPIFDQSNTKTILEKNNVVLKYMDIDYLDQIFKEYKDKGLVSKDKKSLKSLNFDD